jgi:ethanolamine utilization protein EutQ (cupin superfamily)
MSASERLNSASRRYPRVISQKEIDGLPRLEFNTGIDTAIFISQEREDARYFREGICYAKADYQPIRWTQTNFDETQFCLSGKIRVRVEDSSGKQIVLEAGPEEHIYLPAGFTYTLEATGVDSKFLWVSGPSNRPGIVEAPDYSERLRSLRT